MRSGTPERSSFGQPLNTPCPTSSISSGKTTLEMSGQLKNASSPSALKRLGNSTLRKARQPEKARRPMTSTASREGTISSARQFENAWSPISTSPSPPETRRSAKQPLKAPSARSANSTAGLSPRASDSARTLTPRETKGSLAAKHAAGSGMQKTRRPRFRTLPRARRHPQGRRIRETPHRRYGARQAGRTPRARRRSHSALSQSQKASALHSLRALATATASARRGERIGHYAVFGVTHLPPVLTVGAEARVGVSKPWLESRLADACDGVLHGEAAPFVLVELGIARGSRHAQRCIRSHPSKAPREWRGGTPWNGCATRQRYARWPGFAACGASRQVPPLQTASQARSRGHDAQPKGLS